MDSWRRYGTQWKWCSLVASVAFLSAVRTVNSEICGDKARPADSIITDTGNKRFLMLVSTLDGRVTALDVGSGVEEWSISAGAKPLLSSSISQYLEFSGSDGLSRLIPSLDGGLYQYDGNAIEPVPLAADVLLSNSFQFHDGSTVVGGKEVENYGVNIETGQVNQFNSS